MENVCYNLGIIMNVSKVVIKYIGYIKDRQY